MPERENLLSYRIDNRDVLVSVFNYWDRSAIRDGASELASDAILGRNLWDFVSGDAIRHIYKKILERVRSGETLDFDFRCDAPDERRFLSIRISPAENGEVEFETRTIRLEQRPAQDIFLRHTDFTDQLVVACSWCKKIRTHGEVWQEIEQAVVILELFKSEPVPQLSHGMCPDCYEAALKKVAER